MLYGIYYVKNIKYHMMDLLIKQYQKKELNNMLINLIYKYFLQNHNQNIMYLEHILLMKILQQLIK